VNVFTVILMMEENAKKWMDNLAADINAKPVIQILIHAFYV
jgi:hypothetical protein